MRTSKTNMHRDGYSQLNVPLFVGIRFHFHLPFFLYQNRKEFLNEFVIEKKNPVYDLSITVLNRLNSRTNSVK